MKLLQVLPLVQSARRDTAIDVTVTVPLARKYVAVAAEKADSALTRAFNRKVQGAAAACHQQGVVPLPIALETLGGFHKVAVEQVKRIENPDWSVVFDEDIAAS